MRRMNYPRFDKPTYVGTFDASQSNFVMNGIPELGIYFVIVKDTAGGQEYSCMFTIETNILTHCSWYSVGATQEVYLEYSADYGNSISITASGGGVAVNEGSTIELYKLN